MRVENPGVVHKKLEDIHIAGIHLTIKKRKELIPVFDKLAQQYKKYICGPPLAVFYWGTGVQGFDVEAAFPVNQAFETDKIETKILKGAEAFTMLHYGSYEKVGETYQRLYDHMRERGIPACLEGREVYINFSADNPEESVTEIQAIAHDWINRFSESLERVIGDDAKKEVMKGIDKISPQSSKEERAKWLKIAIERLDKLADDEQRFDILSSCAHVFPKKRIEQLRAAYERSNDIDEVLKIMHEDPSWYSKPIRDGNIIRIQKVPYDRESYEAAKDQDEKKKAYCHCPMVRDFLDKIPSTFCYCGSGWFRRFWEGVTGKPVRVEILKSLTNGDDVCEFGVHLLPRS